MNALPLAALAAVVGTYSVATDRLADRFTLDYSSQSSSYQPRYTDDLSINDLVELAAPGLDAARCDGVETLAAAMATDFAAAPVESRVIGDGLQMVLWGSTELNTWAIVHNGQDGIACIVATGMGWTDHTTADQIFEGAPLAT